MLVYNHKPLASGTLGAIVVTNKNNYRVTVTSSTDVLDQQRLDASVASQSQEQRLYIDAVVLVVVFALCVETYADIYSDVTLIVAV